MKKVSMLLLVVFTVCFIFSCKHEPFVSTREVSYRNDILPIVRSSCQHAGCHNPNDPNREFAIDSLVSDIVDEYVEPGDPEASELYERITENDANDIMPKPPYPPLTENQVRLIKLWITQGAKDN